MILAFCWRPFARALTLFFFFFNATATPEIYPLPLHDALPISTPQGRARARRPLRGDQPAVVGPRRQAPRLRFTIGHANPRQGLRRTVRRMRTRPRRHG